MWNLRLVTVGVSYIGLWTENTSDGFIVDETAPVTTRRIALDSRLGSLKQNTQVLLVPLRDV